MEYNMAGGLLVDEEEQQPGSDLIAPDPYQPVYQEGQRMNPRRQLWAGMLMDMGNLFGGWNGSNYGGRQLQGTGFRMQNQARQHNARMDAANQQAKRQYQQDQNQYATQMWQRQQAGQQQQNWQAGHDLNQGEFDYRQQNDAANRQVARQQAQAQLRASGWREVTQPDGTVIGVNDVTGDVRMLKGTTRLQDAVQGQNEASYAEGEAASAEGNPTVSQASSLLNRFIDSKQDFNVGGAFEAIQRITSPLNPFNPGTQGNTDELEQFLNNFTLEKAGELSGVLSDKDISLLEHTKPGLHSQEHVTQKWLYKVAMAEEARKQIQAEKRRIVAQHGPMGLSRRDLFDEEAMRTRLWKEADDNYDAWVNSKQAGGRLGASNHLQRDADDALSRVRNMPVRATGGGY